MDWGAILLVDERFVQKANPNCPDSKKISKWVREQLLIYNDFTKLTTALQKFVDIRTNTLEDSTELSEQSLSNQKICLKLPEID